MAHGVLHLHFQLCITFALDYRFKWKSGSFGRKDCKVFIETSCMTRFDVLPTKVTIRNVVARHPLDCKHHDQLQATYLVTRQIVAGYFDIKMMQQFL